MNRNLLITLTTTFALILSACAPTASNGQDAASTAAAQTLEAQLAESRRQTLEAENALLRDQLATHSAEATFAALTQTALASNVQITSTPTPEEVATVTASEVTNCRGGPGPAYPVTGLLPANQPAEVTGRSQFGDWWLLLLPDGSGGMCWVEGSPQLTFAGNVFAVPYLDTSPDPTFTPGPTAAPGFTARFVNAHECGSNIMLTFEILNTGPDTYESIRITVIDLTLNMTVAEGNNNNPFLSQAAGCPPGASTLGPGQRAFVTIRIANSIQDNQMRAIIRLCTSNGLGGTCLNVAAQFKSP